MRSWISNVSFETSVIYKKVFFYKKKRDHVDGSQECQLSKTLKDRNWVVYPESSPLYSKSVNVAILHGNHSNQIP